MADCISFRGSWGTVWADADTGEIEQYSQAGRDPANGYDNIARFDLAEYRRWVAKLPIPNVMKSMEGDILDVGYWTTKGTRVPPDFEHRVCTEGWSRGGIFRCIGTY